MPRDDWDDDEPQPRRRRRGRDDDIENDDDPFEGGYRRPQSGAVTAIAVIHFVLGAIVVLMSFCGVLVILIVAGEADKAGAFAMPGVGGGFVASFVVVLLIFLWGLAAVVAGIGIVNRSQWARILAMVLAGIAAAGGLFFLFAAVSTLTTNAGAGPVEDQLVGFVACVLIGLLLIGHCVWSFVILLNSRYAAEFR